MVWLVLDRGLWRPAMPQSFLTWGNFSIMFASYAPAAMLALAIIVPLTAGDYDLSVGATLTLSSAVIGVLNVWMHLPILLVLVIVACDRRRSSAWSTRCSSCSSGFPRWSSRWARPRVMSGLVQWITNSSTIGGIDNALVMAVVGGRLFWACLTRSTMRSAAAVVMWYVFDYTPLGRRLLVRRPRPGGRPAQRHRGRPRASWRLGDVRCSCRRSPAFSMPEFSARPIPIRA